MDQPYEISLETQSVCNASCTFCPYPSLDRIGDRMPDELIDKLINEMSEFTEPFVFAPFKVNEPLLDKRLIPICKEVEGKTCAEIRIFTNASALTQIKVDELSKLNRIKHLWVSLNSHHKSEYEELMGISFEKTVSNLDNLHRQNVFPVVVSSVGFPNYEFIQYCSERWPKFEPIVLKQDAWLDYADSQVGVVPDSPCSRWFELSIASSGIVTLCCMDGEGKYPIGDVRENTLLEVYNSPHWKDRRERMLSRREVPVCKTCTY